MAELDVSDTAGFVPLTESGEVVTAQAGFVAMRQPGDIVSAQAGFVALLLPGAVRRRCGPMIA